MKFSNVWPAVGLWIVLDILFYIASVASPAAGMAFAANMYFIGTVLAVLIGFWAGKLVGKQDYTDATVAGIAAGLGCAIPAIILFGYGAGTLDGSIAFGVLMVIVSIGSAIVGNKWK